ncbi:MAG: helix-turn-helix transcriptional regulator [Usitatibacteraceae bacterium]
MVRKTVYSPESRLLANFLSEARRRAGVLQSEVAEKMGTDQTVISNIERGQRRIDVVEFYRFAKAIDADPTTLFESAIEEWEKPK